MTAVALHMLLPVQFMGAMSQEHNGVLRNAHLPACGHIELSLVNNG